MSTRRALHPPPGLRARRHAPARGGAALLARAGRELAGSLEADEIVAALSALAAGLADACTVQLAAGEGEGSRSGAAGGRRRTLAGTDAPGVLLVLPLEAHGELLGTLTLARSDGRPLGAADRRTARVLAEMAALALHNARSHARALRAVRVRDEVLGVVAHDLRNPLMAVSMYTHLLQEAGLTAAQEDWTGVMLCSIDRMNGLIQDLLDAAALDQGRLRVEPSPTAVAPLLAAAAQLLERQAQERGLRLTWQAPSDLPAVVADADRVLQVLSNLLGNAVKFSPPGAEVALGAERRGDEVVVTVRDAGPGIAPDDLPRVFDRFWQGGGARGGAGLGLAIARGIVESHGGRIAVESTPGAGSTFSFSLPVSAEPAAGGEARARAPGGAGGEGVRVLLVDDHPTIRRGLRELLRRRPGLLVVGEAATADEAVERTAELAPDVVLMDLNLPGGGLQATRRIAREHPAARVLILTAESDDACVRAALDAGARGYLRKSTDPASLVAAIRTVRNDTLVLDAGLRGRAAAAAAVPGAVPGPEALRVLALDAAGYGTADIAARLRLPRRAVHLHRAQGMRALGVATRAELVRHALREGWLAAAPPAGGCPADPVPAG